MLPPGAPPLAPPAPTAPSLGQEESPGRRSRSARGFVPLLLQGCGRGGRPARPILSSHPRGAGGGAGQPRCSPPGKGFAGGRGPAGSGRGAQKGRAERLHRAWRRISFQVAAPLHQGYQAAPGFRAPLTAASIRGPRMDLVSQGSSC